MYGGDWKKFYHDEKNATCKALAVALKKTKTFYYFPDFISIFQTFPWIQDSVRTLDFPAGQVLFYAHLLMGKEPCK